MFSQRHYVAIADLLKETGFDNPHLVEAFCGLFAKDNDRFKPERFKKAVGFDESLLTPVEVRHDPLDFGNGNPDLLYSRANLRKAMMTIGHPEAL